MHDSRHLDLIAAALQEPDACSALHRVAETLSAQGVPQQVLYDLFEYHRALHELDSDETLYDCILDVLDRIVGWCAHNRLYNTYYDPA